MSPERFHLLNAEHGPLADSMSVETRTDVMGSAWIVYLLHEGRRHVAAFFASSDVFAACEWVAALRRLEAAVHAC